MFHFNQSSDIPSGYVKIAIENDHIYSGFTHKKMVNFHSYVSLPEGSDHEIVDLPIE